MNADEHDLYAPISSLDSDRTAKRNLLASEYSKNHESRAARSTWKLLELMALIGNHGYTSIPVVMLAWNASERTVRRTLKVYCERGLIRFLSLPGSARTLVGLTSWGAAEARATIKTCTAGPLTPSRFARTLVAHNLAVQRASIAHDRRCNLEQPGLHLAGYRTEVIIGEDLHGKSIRVDALVGTVAIEVELSPKNRARVTRKMADAGFAISQGSISEMIYYATPGQVANGLIKGRAHSKRNNRWLADSIKCIKIVSAAWLTQVL